MAPTLKLVLVATITAAIFLTSQEVQGQMGLTVKAECDEMAKMQLETCYRQLEAEKKEFEEVKEKSNIAYNQCQQKLEDVKKRTTSDEECTIKMQSENKRCHDNLDRCAY